MINTADKDTAARDYFLISHINTSPPIPACCSAVCDGSRQSAVHRAHDLSGARAGRHTPSSWHTSGMGLRMLYHIQKCPCPPQPGEGALPFPGTPGVSKPSQHYNVYLPFTMLQNCLDLFSKRCSWDWDPSKCGSRCWSWRAGNPESPESPTWEVGRRRGEPVNQKAMGLSCSSEWLDSHRWWEGDIKCILHDWTCEYKQKFPAYMKERRREEGLKERGKAKAKAMYV